MYTTPNQNPKRTSLVAGCEVEALHEQTSMACAKLRALRLRTWIWDNWRRVLTTVVAKLSPVYLQLWFEGPDEGDGESEVEWQDRKREMRLAVRNHLILYLYIHMYTCCLCSWIFGIYVGTYVACVCVCPFNFAEWCRNYLTCFPINGQGLQHGVCGVAWPGWWFSFGLVWNRALIWPGTLTIRMAVT